MAAADPQEVKVRKFLYSLPASLYNQKMNESLDSTRQLCAAAHLNWNFRWEVIDQFVEMDRRQECRSIAPCHGVNLAALVKQALIAQKRANTFTLLLLFPSLIFMFMLLSPPSGVEYLSRDTIALCCFCFSVFIVFVEAILMKLAALKVLFASSSGFLGQNLVLDDKLEKRIADISEGNLFIHSGYNPFSSFGSALRGWSFAVNIQRGKDVLGEIAAPTAFGTEDLYEYIDSQLRELKIPEIKLSDSLFINGQAVRSKQAILPDPLSPPVTSIDAEPFISNPDLDRDIRYYKCIQLIGWVVILCRQCFLDFQLGNFSSLKHFITFFRRFTRIIVIRKR